jgi:hypothetical protein
MVAQLAALALATAFGAAPDAPATRAIDCDGGRKPGYYVPAAGPVTVVGCAMLGLSGRPIEFSVNAERFMGRTGFCINPAFRGRGSPGMYIPASCSDDLPPDEFEVWYSGIPRQGVRGYRRVVWGTAAPGTERVVAGYDRGVTRAAVFDTRRGFSLFVLELPVETGCLTVTLRGSGGQRGRVGARRNVCTRA